MRQSRSRRFPYAAPKRFISLCDQSNMQGARHDRSRSIVPHRTRHRAPLRGIGYSWQKQLAAAGAHVLAVARTVGGLEELDRPRSSRPVGEATLVPLEPVPTHGGLDRLGGANQRTLGQADIMVADAAILGVIGPVGHIQAKTFDKVMMAHSPPPWRLIRSLEPGRCANPCGAAVLCRQGWRTARAPSGRPTRRRGARSRLRPRSGDETRTARSDQFGQSGRQRTPCGASPCLAKILSPCRTPRRSPARMLPLVGPDLK